MQMSGIVESILYIYKSENWYGILWLNIWNIDTNICEKEPRGEMFKSMFTQEQIYKFAI